jgi:hypothetical protein
MSNTGENNRQLSSNSDNRVAKAATNPASFLQDAIRNLTPEQVNALAAQAADKALELEVDRVRHDQEHASAQAMIAEHKELVNDLSRPGQVNKHSVTTEVKTGRGRMQVTSSTRSSCFVATAAYGDADHIDVATLRAYRDEVLQHHAAGRAFIQAYWIVGPVFARIVKCCPGLRPLARRALRPAVRHATNCLEARCTRGTCADSRHARCDTL